MATPLTPFSEVHYFGGYADGHHEPVSDGVTSASVPRTKGQPGPRMMYVHSAAWSAHLGKRTFIPSTFPGKPPRETQAA